MSIAPCTPTTPVHGVVVFEPALFKVRFPAFATVSDLSLTVNFKLATLQLANRCGSRVKSATLRSALLDLLVAHITALLNGVNGAAPSGLVGRVESATQGSVSVTSKWDGAVSEMQAYYLQTQWGAMYWQATAQFRTAIYIAPPQRGCGPVYPGAGTDIGPTGTGFCGNNGGSC